MGNTVDRIVGFFSPRAGLRRHFERVALERAYEGASQRDGWKPRRSGASANTDHMADASALRARSRSLVQNVPYIAQALRALTANAIGTGITPRWTGKQGEEFNRLWKEWVPVADADGRLDMYGLQAAAYRAVQQDGEVLIRLRTRRPEDGLPVPLQLQLLEIDWLDSSKMGSNGPNTIINGIEYDVIGRVAGYWLFDQHPGELASFKPVRAASKFVPAAGIIHLYNPERPGQGRGFPRLAPVIASVRDLSLYEDAELARKNLETRLSVLMSGDPTELDAPSLDGSPPPSREERQRTGELGQLGSGNIMQTPAGSTITVVEPKVAPGYVEYVKQRQHLIAAGFGVTYEMMTGDVSETNFSSARVRIMDFRREVEMEQWLFFIPKFCDRVCRAFADAAALGGSVRQASYEIEHSTPKWDYVNPQQDVRSDLEEVAGGLGTISEKLRRRGYRPDQVFAEWQADMEKLKKTGMLDVMLMLLKGRQMDAGGAPNATS